VNSYKQAVGDSISTVLHLYQLTTAYISIHERCGIVRIEKMPVAKDWIAKHSLGGIIHSVE